MSSSPSAPSFGAPAQQPPPETTVTLPPPPSQPQPSQPQLSQPQLSQPQPPQSQPQAAATGASPGPALSVPAPPEYSEVTKTQLQQPVQQGAVPFQQGAVPFQQGAVPFQQGAVPFQQGAVPFQQGAVPFQQGAVPVQQRAIPVQQGAVQFQQGAAPVQQGAFPVQYVQQPGQPQCVYMPGAQPAVQTTPYMVPTQFQPIAIPRPNYPGPHDFLILSVITTTILALLNLTSLVFGIPAIIFSIQSKERKDSTDYNAAKQYANVSLGLIITNIAYVLGSAVLAIGLTLGLYCRNSYYYC